MKFKTIMQLSDVIENTHLKIDGVKFRVVKGVIYIKHEFSFYSLSLSHTHTHTHTIFIYLYIPLYTHT